MNTTTTTAANNTDIQAIHFFPSREAMRLAAKDSTLKMHDFGKDVPKGQRWALVIESVEAAPALDNVDSVPCEAIAADEATHEIKQLAKVAKAVQHFEANSCTRMRSKDIEIKNRFGVVVKKVPIVIKPKRNLKALALALQECFA